MIPNLMRAHLLYAVVAAIGAVALPIYYWVLIPDPSLLLNNKTFFAAVSGITDPATLVAVVRQISRDADAFFLTTRDMLDATIVLLSVVLAAVAATFLHSYLALRRISAAEEEIQRSADSALSPDATADRNTPAAPSRSPQG